MIIREGEQELVNPGNKRCRFCGGLIKTPTYIVLGCNNRCASDKCLPRGRKKRLSGKQIKKKVVRRLGYLLEDN